MKEFLHFFNRTGKKGVLNSAMYDNAQTAVEMLSVLHATGVSVHIAENEFTADGVQYPDGDLYHVLRPAQRAEAPEADAFRCSLPQRIMP